MTEVNISIARRIVEINLLSDKPWSELEWDAAGQAVVQDALRALLRQQGVVGREELAQRIFPEAFDGTLGGELAPAKREQARQIADRLMPFLPASPPVIPLSSAGGSALPIDGRNASPPVEGPFAYVPMPLNVEGAGPADPQEAVRTEHQVWDMTDNSTVCTCRDKATADRIVAALNSSPVGETEGWREVLVNARKVIVAYMLLAETPSEEIEAQVAFIDAALSKPPPEVEQLRKALEDVGTALTQAWKKADDRIIEALDIIEPALTTGEG